MRILACTACLFVLACCTITLQPDQATLPDRAEAPSSEHPQSAVEWHRLRLLDEHGRVDPAAPAQARAKRDASVAYFESIDNAGIGRFGWEERGPDNVGGRTRSILIHPSNPNELWAGAVSGGVWHSTDGGSSWRPLDGLSHNLQIGCLAMEPGNPSVLYAGTGEDRQVAGVSSGAGIFRSVDGGVTWNQLGRTSDWQYVNRIAVSPTDTRVLLAATRSPGGIFRSADRGASWTQVLGADSGLQVLFDPNDPNRAVASLLDAGNNRAVWSRDAGQTWATSSTGLDGNPATANDRIELTYARSTPGLLYASSWFHCWRSTDGGANWTRLGNLGASAFSFNWWYHNTIWADPTNSLLVIIGGQLLYRSTDGGLTFTQISNEWFATGQPHVDFHAVVEDPRYDGNTNRKVWVGTDGGLWCADDIRAAGLSSAGHGATGVTALPSSTASPARA